MSKIKLTYWDMPGGRGEPMRLALTIGKIDFEDHRISFADWPKFRDQSPFHACPYAEIDGRVISQSNTLTRYAGRLSGLYPEDAFQAALCDEVLDAIEDMWVKIGATMGIKEPAALEKARTELRDGPYTRYLSQLNERLKQAGGEYFADGRLTVADLQMFVMCRALASGHFDHIPKDLVAKVAPEIAAHMKRVADHPPIKEYYKELFAAAKG